MNTPNDCDDHEISEVYEGRWPRLNAETLADGRVNEKPRFAPVKPHGTPIYFADEIPIKWLLEKLAEIGLITTRWISDGKLHSVLSVEARARISAEIEAGRARMRAVQEGNEQ